MLGFIDIILWSLAFLSFVWLFFGSSLISAVLSATFIYFILALICLTLQLELLGLFIILVYVGALVVMLLFVLMTQNDLQAPSFSWNNYQKVVFVFFIALVLYLSLNLARLNPTLSGVLAYSFSNSSHAWFLNSSMTTSSFLSQLSYSIYWLQAPSVIIIGVLLFVTLLAVNLILPSVSKPKQQAASPSFQVSRSNSFRSHFIMDWSVSSSLGSFVTVLSNSEPIEHTRVTLDWFHSYDCGVSFALSFLFFAFVLVSLIFVPRSFIKLLLIVELLFLVILVQLAMISSLRGDMSGIAFVFFVLGILACETAIGLSLYLSYTNRLTLIRDKFTGLNK